jgi:hypothetical protein
VGVKGPADAKRVKTAFELGERSAASTTLEVAVTVTKCTTPPYYLVAVNCSNPGLNYNIIRGYRNLRLST